MAYTSDECVWVVFDPYRGDQIFEEDHVHATDQILFFSPFPSNRIQYYVEPTQSPYPYRKTIHYEWLGNPSNRYTYTFLIPKQHIVDQFNDLEYCKNHRFIIMCRYPGQGYNRWALIPPYDTNYVNIDPITRVLFE